MDIQIRKKQLPLLLLSGLFFIPSVYAQASSGYALVNNASELEKAVAEHVATIEVGKNIDKLNTLKLAVGQSISSREGHQYQLSFSGNQGVLMNKDTTLSGLRVAVNPLANAIGFADDVQQLADLGTVKLSNISTLGGVNFKLLPESGVSSGQIIINNTHVEDYQAPDQAPSDVINGFGVNLLQGAVTIWNQSTHSSSTVTANLNDVSVGSSSTPIKGSGILVAGTENGGHVEVNNINSGSTFVTSNYGNHTDYPTITGNIYTVFNTVTNNITVNGLTESYGDNGMGVGTWSRVNNVTVNRIPGSLYTISTYGESADPVVNIGTMNKVTLNGGLITRGKGARALNNYQGGMEQLVINGPISTEGDGSAALDLNAELGEIQVNAPITTQGGIAESLYLGKMLPLTSSAIVIHGESKIGKMILNANLSSQKEKGSHQILYYSPVELDRFLQNNAAQLTDVVKGSKEDDPINAK